MKRFKITPVLLLAPVLTVLYILHIQSGWTSFSLILILVSVIVMLLIITVDRLLVTKSNLKRAWIVESILILLIVLYLMKVVI